MEICRQHFRKVNTCYNTHIRAKQIQFDLFRFDTSNWKFRRWQLKAIWIFGILLLWKLPSFFSFPYFRHLFERYLRKNCVGITTARNRRGPRQEEVSAVWIQLLYIFMHSQIGNQFFPEQNCLVNISWTIDSQIILLYK